MTCHNIREGFRYNLHICVFLFALFSLPPLLLPLCFCLSVCLSACLFLSLSLSHIPLLISVWSPLIFVHLPTCLPFPSCLSVCSLFTLSPIISLSLSLSLSLTGLQATKISQPSHTSNAPLQKDQRSYLTEFSPCLRSP